MRKRKVSIPVLLAEPHKDYQVKVWCPFCAKYHFHGLSLGKKHAHCSSSDSPFKSTGYIIKLKH